MAKTIPTLKLDIQVTLVLNEAEARMLVAMTKYGPDSFLRGYYKLLGKSYMKPHEKALKSFFSSIDSVLPLQLAKIDKARAVFDGSPP